MTVKTLADPASPDADDTLRGAAGARAYVIHPEIRRAGQMVRDAETQLEEALNLADALFLDVAGGEIARLSTPRAGWLFGAGKVEELGARVSAEDVELVIVNGAITPKQQQNLERAWKTKVLDRTGLILEIFGDRARTREGSLQVELAHLEYQRSRLVRSWTHLERQRGGLGFVGGPGETQIEADRRALDERMIKIRRQLEKTVRTRGLQRGARKRVPFPVVALVGYTNAGKSTLFNRLTGAAVMAKDMLFATLDPTMRALDLPSGGQIILSDTVGFIADLPTQLIASFRATLEEVLEADVILHVRDAASDDADAQDEDVKETLAALGVDDAARDQIIVVHNKSDLLGSNERAALTEAASRRPGEVVVSALSGAGLDDLTTLIEDRIAANNVVRRIRLSYGSGEALAWIYRNCSVIERQDRDECIELEASATIAVFDRLYSRFRNLT